MERACSVVVDLQSLKKEDLNEMSMVETAYALMVDKRQPYNFYDLLEAVAKIKGLSKTEMDARISFLYTDLNIDGRFLTLGDNKWGLKAWYPHEQSEEEITISAIPAKRRKSKNDDDDEYVFDNDVEEDEFEDLEDELDELADEEDQDDDDEFDDKDDDDDSLPDFDEDEEHSEEEED